MFLDRREFLQAATCTAALVATERTAWAQTYPTRAVRVVVPVAAGGLNDVTARLTGQWLSEHLGQQFFIENRPGAGTNLGTEAAIRASADGYTLLIAAAAPQSTRPCSKRSASILSVTPRRSRASSACPSSCKSIHRSRLERS